MAEKCFQLIRTNPLLTTNVKIVVDSEYKMYLESYSVDDVLSKVEYKHYNFPKEYDYPRVISSYYYKTPDSSIYNVYNLNDNTEVSEKLENQFDETYWAGAKQVDDKYYKEEFQYNAPLYVNVNKIPESFIILRVDDPAIFNEENGYLLETLHKDNFRKEIIDKWKAVQVYDLKISSDFGEWLDRNINKRTEYPKYPLDINLKQGNNSIWYGIDYNIGAYGSREENLNDYFFYEKPHYNLEKYLTNGFKRNNLIYSNILNLSFLYDDTPATPFELRKYSMNRYYGFYAEKMDYIGDITSYNVPTLNTGITLKNNIFVDAVNTNLVVEPFEWLEGNEYFLYANGRLYKVVRKQLPSGLYQYQVISDLDLSISNFSLPWIADIIFTQSGTNYKNVLIPKTNEFRIDPYYTRENKLEGLFADLYLVNIDNKYHVLKYDTKSEYEQFVAGGIIFSGSNYNVNEVNVDDDYIYLGTTRGIVVFDHNGNQIWSGNTSNSDLPSNNVQTIFLQNKKLYVGTDKGIWVKDFSNLQYFGNTIYSSLAGTANLPNDNIKKIYVKDNYIVVSMISGGFWYWWLNVRDSQINYLSGVTRKLIDGYSISDFSIDGTSLFVCEQYRMRKYFDLNPDYYYDYNPINVLSLSATTMNKVTVLNGIIYLGTDNGIWIKNGPFEKQYNNRTGYAFTSNNIVDMCVREEEGSIVTIVSGVTNAVNILSIFDNTVNVYLSGSTVFNSISCIPNKFLVSSYDSYSFYHLPISEEEILSYFEYYLQTDYGINSNKNILEYWIEGRETKNYKSKNTHVIGETPLTFPVYRVKFCEIKDFDFDRVYTHFSDFDYEEDSTYVDTLEHKLYVTERRTEDNMDKKYQFLNETYKNMPAESVYSDKIMITSSEYVSTEELFEISNTQNLDKYDGDKILSDIWSLNPSICKWGYIGSVSHSDYPYKFNNSNRVGGPFNRTTNMFEIRPDIVEKNLDYMYRIGDFISNNEYKHYFQQSTNIETSQFDPDSRMFNLDLYIGSNFDYFDYFFNNRMISQSIDSEFLKTTQKFATFSDSSEVRGATALFKGLQIELFDLANVSRKEDGTITLIEKNLTKSYDDYKLSIIFNPAYAFDDMDHRTIEPLEWYNPLYLDAYDWYNTYLGIRTFDSGETYNLKLSSTTYTSLTYKILEPVKVSKVINIEDDVIKYYKKQGRLFLKVINASVSLMPPIYQFFDIDESNNYVYFTGNTYYINNTDSGNTVDEFYMLSGTTKESFIELINWDEDDFNNSYLNWINSGVLYQLDNAYTNGGVLDTRNVLENEKNGIHVFVNDIYKNVVCIVNNKVGIDKSMINLNNIDIFGEKTGFYTGNDLDGNSINISRYSELINSATTNTGDLLPSNNVKYLTFDKDYLYVVTNNGLWIYDKENKKGYTIKSTTAIGSSIWLLSGTSFSSNNLLKILKDKTNNKIYVLTDNNFIWCLDLNTKFGFNINSITGITGGNMPSGTITDFLIDENRNSLHVAYSSQIWIYDITNNISITINNSFTNYNIIKDIDNNILVSVGNIDNSIWIYNLNTNEEKVLYDVVYNGINTAELKLGNIKNNILYYSAYITYDDGMMYYHNIHEIHTLNLLTNEISIIKTEDYLSDNSSYPPITITGISYLKYFDGKILGLNYDRYYYDTNPNPHFSESINNIIIFNIPNGTNLTGKTFDVINYTSQLLPPSSDYDLLLLDEENYEIFIISKYGLQRIYLNYQPKYDPSDIIAYNFSKALNEPDNIITFDEYVTYHHIDEDNNYNRYTFDLTSKPPFMLNVLEPDLLTLKKSSYTVDAVRGPETNIYDKYVPEGESYLDNYINEPLARILNLDVTTDDNSYKYIYRFSGNYEPIFKNIEIFDKKDYYWDYNNNTIYLYDEQYRFNTDFDKFGYVEEFFLTKVSLEGQILRLDGTTDKSIYPMVDEFGLSFSPRFIFKSSWDNDYFYLYNKNVQNISEL